MYCVVLWSAFEVTVALLQQLATCVQGYTQWEVQHNASRCFFEGARACRAFSFDVPGMHGSDVSTRN